MEASFETVLLNATLRPNPPMSKAGLKLVVGAVAGINLGFGLFFAMHGAWPVTPFMGADVLFLAWALNATHIAAQAFERVQLTTSLLSVLQHSARGRESETSFNPYWVRVEMDDPPQCTSRLMLWTHGRGVQIGRFLQPRERLSFAKALRSALARAREARGG